MAMWLCFGASGCPRATVGSDGPDAADAGASVGTVPARAGRAACGGRAACAALSVAVAGKDAKDEDLVVVIVPTESGESHDLQSWLVAVPAGGEAWRMQLVAECSSCSASVEVVGNDRVRYVEEGPASTRTYELALNPPSVRPVSERWSAIPVIDVGDLAEFDRGAWKSTGLGDCAARVEPSPDDSVARTPSVRVLASRSTLYIEVDDDAFVTTGAIGSVLSMTFCGGDGKPTSCESWALAMDGSLVVTGAPRQSSTGEWSASKRARRAEVSIVSPTSRRFRLVGLPSPFHAETAQFGYRGGADGRASDLALGSSLVFRPDAAPLRHCVAREGNLSRVHWAPEGGPAEALIPLVEGG